MKLLEHQAKDLLASYGMPRPPGRVCRAAREAGGAYEDLAREAEGGGDGRPAGRVVLKAQVPAGKRGKGGGIRFAASRDEAVREAGELIGMEVSGYTVEQVLVEQAADVEAELYAGVLTDTSAGHVAPLLMLSAEGGMDVEELSAEAPEKLVSRHVDPRYGYHPYLGRELARQAGIGRNLWRSIAGILGVAYEAYRQNDAELVEINPLAALADGSVVALDAKMTVDNSALYRHEGLEGFRTDSAESRAAALGLAYVPLDGNIGIISNGAGLTMGTMDHLSLVGGRPANFMDTGQRILEDGIRDGLDILFSSPNVEVVLINVFGGGVRCDVIAQKIREVIADGGAPLPVVVSLNGRNDEAGRSILCEPALDGVSVHADIDEALRLATELAEGRSEAEPGADPGADPVSGRGGAS